MNYEVFAEKIKQYCRVTGNSLKTLAHELGIHPSLLSHKLNGTSNRTLTHAEAKEIIKILVGWEAITNREEARELLNLLNYPFFNKTELSSDPLNRLEVNGPGSGSDNPWGTVKPPFSRVSHKASISGTSGEVITNNLPLQLSSFIGLILLRDRILAKRGEGRH